MLVIISMKIVTFRATKAIVTDFDCGEFTADSISVILLSLILNLYHYRREGLNDQIIKISA